MVATYLLLLAMGVDKLHCALRALAWPCGLLRGLMALAGFFRALLDGDGLLLWLLPWLLSHVVSRPPSITGAHHTSLLLGRHKSQSLNYLQLRPPFDACGIRAATVFCLCRATCITGRREACGHGMHAAVGGMRPWEVSAGLGSCGERANKRAETGSFTAVMGRACRC